MEIIRSRKCVEHANKTQVNYVSRKLSELGAWLEHCNNKERDQDSVSAQDVFCSVDIQLSKLSLKIFWNFAIYPSTLPPKNKDTNLLFINLDKIVKHLLEKYWHSKQREYEKLHVSCNEPSMRRTLKKKRCIQK